MPTREQIEAVMAEAQALRESSFEPLSATAARSYLSSPPEGAIGWDALNRDQRVFVLETNLNWAGFSFDQELATIEVIAEGLPETDWGLDQGEPAWMEEMGSMFRDMSNPPEELRPAPTERQVYEAVSQYGGKLGQVAVQALEEHDRNLDESAASGKYIKRDKEIER